MMPVKCVAEHVQLQAATINHLHVPVTAFMFSCSGTQCTTQKDEASGKPCAVIDAL